MSDIAIRVEGLGKQYKIGRLQKRNDTLRDVLADRVSRIANRKNGSNGDTQFATSNPPSADTIWALRDVSFEVKRGEVVGIIGRNGAGKSTLLKILSRITEPTAGSVDIFGRVGSLLEVGTGFHPELTGRENIFLNGAILGMRRVDIERRFDEIVAFSEVEKFIDTPVKRYSSGMYVRLAFAVAAHLEPEILVVDEVLAVGDAAFQKKCLGKMEDVAHEGRTVLFVSHNMATISQLCSRAVWLNNGAIMIDDEARQVVEGYLKTSENLREGTVHFEHLSNSCNESVVPLMISTRTSNGDGESIFRMDEEIVIQITIKVISATPDFHLFLNAYAQNDVLAFGTASWDALGLHPERMVMPGIFTYTCVIPPYLLNKGDYTLSFNGQTPGRGFIFSVDRVLVFSVAGIGGVGSAKSAERPGIFRPFLNWQVDQSDET